MSEAIENIFRNGAYYNPAKKHYNFKGIVQCDICKDVDVPVCVGHVDGDLCLECAGDLYF